MKTIRRQVTGPGARCWATVAVLILTGCAVGWTFWHVGANARGVMTRQSSVGAANSPGPAAH